MHKDNVKIPKCQNIWPCSGQYFPVLPLHWLLEGVETWQFEQEKQAYFLQDVEAILVLGVQICHSARYEKEKEMNIIKQILASKTLIEFAYMATILYSCIT